MIRLSNKGDVCQPLNSLGMHVLVMAHLDSLGMHVLVMAHLDLLGMHVLVMAHLDSLGMHVLVMAHLDLLGTHVLVTAYLDSLGRHVLVTAYLDSLGMHDYSDFHGESPPQKGLIFIRPFMKVLVYGVTEKGIYFAHNFDKIIMIRGMPP